MLLLILLMIGATFASTLEHTDDPSAGSASEAAAMLDALHANRTPTLTLSFEPSTLRLSPTPLVNPGEHLAVEVDWEPNPDGWESVVLHDFTDLKGGPVQTEPAELKLTPDSPKGSIEVIQKSGPFVRYEITYSRTAGGVEQTWTIDPEWEQWP
jgi:hypothetical protein